MNMIVCVKHVLRTENVHLKAGEEFSPVGLAGRLNLFDTFAIEAAARIKKNFPMRRFFCSQSAVKEQKEL